MYRIDTSVMRSIFLLQFLFYKFRKSLGFLHRAFVIAASLSVLMRSAPLHLSHSAHSGTLSPSPALPLPLLRCLPEQRRTSAMAERKRSAVWHYFTASDRETATCDICRKAIRSYGNTTNLYKHLKAGHPNINAELQSKRREEEEEKASQTQTRPQARRQMSLTEAFQKPQQYPGSNF